MRLGSGSPSIDFNGTKYTSIEGSAADNNISIDNVRGKGKFNPLSEPGIALTTQQARELGVKVGDKVSVRDNKTGAVHTATFYDGAGSKRPGNEKLAHFEVSPALADTLGIKYRNSKGKVVDAVTNRESLAGRFSIEKYSGEKEGSGFTAAQKPGPSSGLHAAHFNHPSAQTVDQLVKDFDHKYKPGPSLAAVKSGSAELKIGDSGPAVKALQRKLGVEPDGQFGPITLRALVNAQRQANVHGGTLGHAGRTTFEKIANRSNDGFSAPSPSRPGQTTAPAVTGAQVHGTAAMQQLARDAQRVALGMGGYHGQGKCATGVSRAIQSSLGISVHGNGNQIDNNLPRSHFREVHMSLEEALRTPGLVLTWEHTSTRLGSIYGHTAVTLGDGRSSASDFVERNTLAAESGRRGLKIFQPI